LSFLGYHPHFFCSPGSINDTEATKTLTAILLDPAMTIPRHVLLADVAFKGDGADKAYLTLLSVREHLSPTAPRGSVHGLSTWLLSKRNAVEWCMNTLQMTFRRLSTKLPADTEERKELMLIIRHLHNLRVRHGARTQMGTVYADSARVGEDAAAEEDDLEALDARLSMVAPEDISTYLDELDFDAMAGAEIEGDECDEL
jgi:hypothetical protein